MLVPRNGIQPRVDESAWVAATANLVGDVDVGPGCAIDHGALIVSSGPPIRLGTGVAVMAGAVIRSTGGDETRPAFAVEVGDECLIGPAAALVGCVLGDAVYVATQVMIFHGARIGSGTRLGAGSIVHTGAVLPANSRVGMRQYAVARPGIAALITGDLEAARHHLAEADFFGAVFDIDQAGQQDLAELHRRATRTVIRELRSE